MNCLMKAILAGIAGVLLLTSMVGSVDAANVPDWVKNNAGWWQKAKLTMLHLFLVFNT